MVDKSVYEEGACGHTDIQGHALYPHNWQRLQKLKLAVFSHSTIPPTTIKINRNCPTPSRPTHATAPPSSSPAAQPTCPKQSCSRTTTSWQPATGCTTTIHRTGAVASARSSYRLCRTCMRYMSALPCVAGWARMCASCRGSNWSCIVG